MSVYPGLLSPSNRCLSLLQKLQIQEKAINEVKTAIKPFYQRKEISKEEYKEIVRKAVEKVKSAHSDISPSAVGEPPPLLPIFSHLLVENRKAFN